MKHQGIPVLPSGDPVHLTIVFAANYSHAAAWAHYSQVNRRSRNLIIVCSPFDLQHRVRGIRRPLYTFYGPWYNAAGPHFGYSRDVMQALRATEAEHWYDDAWDAYNIDPNVVEGEAS